MRTPGEVGRIAMKDVVIRCRPRLLVGGKLQGAGERLLQAVDRCVDIAPLAEQFAGFPPVRRIVEPEAGLEQGGDDGLVGVRVALRPCPGDRKDLFRVVVPDVMAGDQGAAEPLGDRVGVPGFPHAVACDQSGAQVMSDLGRRDHGQPQVFVRVDARIGHPVAQQVIVRRLGIDHCEGQFRAVCRAVLLDDPLERPGRTVRRVEFAHTGRKQPSVQFLGDGDGVAVEVQAQCRHHGLALLIVQGACERHRRQHLGAVQHAGAHLVADVGPGRFA